MEMQFQPQQLSQQEVKSVQAAFITRVYAWMTLALALTGLVSMYVITSETLIELIFGNRLVFFGLYIGELALVGWLSGLVGKISARTATVVFLIYAVINGITLSVLFFAFTASSIASTFFITAGTFGLMSLVGYFTKTDLTRLGPVLLMALFGIIIASVVNYFLQSESMYWFISFAGVAIFIGLIAYDTQKLKEMSLGIMGDAELQHKATIMGALALYLDFINLFIFLLRIFGRRR